MSRIILACALAGILGVPAKADETLKWRHVHHLTGFQTQQVCDADGHTLNLFRLPGIAFFPDGSIGTTLVIGTSDVTRVLGQQLTTITPLTSQMAQRYGVSNLQQQSLPRQRPQQS